MPVADPRETSSVSGTARTEWQRSLDAVSQRSQLWLERLAARAPRSLPGGIETVEDDFARHLQDARRCARPIIFRSPSYAVSLDALVGLLDDPVVEVRRGDYVAAAFTDARSHEQMRLTDYLALCGMGFTEDPPPYVARHPVGESLNNLSSFRTLGGLGTNSYLWLGPPGARTPLHADVAHNVVLQLAGAKAFELISPANLDRLNVEWIYSRLVKADLTLAPSQTDLRDCVNRVVLQGGDGLYIPPGWFHYAEVSVFGATLNHFQESVPVEVLRGP